MNAQIRYITNQHGKPIVLNGKPILDRFDDTKDINNINKQLMKEIETQINKFFENNEEKLANGQLGQTDIDNFLPLIFQYKKTNIVRGYTSISHKVEEILDYSVNTEDSKEYVYPSVRFTNNRFVSLMDYPTMIPGLTRIKIYLKYLEKAGFNFLKNPHFKEVANFIVNTLPSLDEQTFLYQNSIKSKEMCIAKAKKLLQDFKDQTKKSEIEIGILGKKDFLNQLSELTPNRGVYNAVRSFLDEFNESPDKDITDQEFIELLKKYPDPAIIEEDLDLCFSDSETYLEDCDSFWKLFCLFIVRRVIEYFRARAQEKFVEKAVHARIVLTFYVDLVEKFYITLPPDFADARKSVKELIESKEVADFIKDKLLSTISEYTVSVKSKEEGASFLENSKVRYYGLAKMLIDMLGNELNKLKEEEKTIEETQNAIPVKEILEQTIEKPEKLKELEKEEEEVPEKPRKIQKQQLEEVQSKEETYQEKVFRTYYTYCHIVVKLDEEFLESLADEELKKINDTLERFEEKGFLNQFGIGKPGVKMEGDKIRVKPKGERKTQIVGYQTSAKGEESGKVEYTLVGKVSAKEIHRKAQKRQELMASLEKSHKRTIFLAQSKGKDLEGEAPKKKTK